MPSGGAATLALSTLQEMNMQQPVSEGMHHLHDLSMKLIEAAPNMLGYLAAGGMTEAAGGTRVRAGLS